MFDEVAGLIVRTPRNPKLNRTASIGAPGMIGSITVMNCSGLTLGVNLLRSYAAAMKQVGLPSTILLRYISERAKTVDEVEFYMRQTSHGVPWLYTAMDANGNRRVFEVISEDTRRKERYQLNLMESYVRTMGSDNGTRGLKKV